MLTELQQVPFDSQPTLKGDLLELRPLRTEDYEDLYGVARDPLLWEQHPANNRHEEQVFRRFFHEALTSGGALLVVDTKTQKVIGSSRFHGYDQGQSEVEIGWTFLARSYWGGKYNREMKQLMLEHAFRFVRSVVFFVGLQNFRSQRALEKIGAVRVGQRPNADGRDSYVYQILLWSSHNVPSSPQMQQTGRISARLRAGPSCGAAVEALNCAGAGSIGPAADLHSARQTQPMSVAGELELTRRLYVMLLSPNAVHQLFAALFLCAAAPLQAQQSTDSSVARPDTGKPKTPPPIWRDSVRYGGGPSVGAPPSDYTGATPPSQWCLQAVKRARGDLGRTGENWTDVSRSWLRQVLSDTTHWGVIWRRVLGGAPQLTSQDSIVQVMDEGECHGIAELVNREVLGWKVGPPPMVVFLVRDYLIAYPSNARRGEFGLAVGMNRKHQIGGVATW